MRRSNELFLLALLLVTSNHLNVSVAVPQCPGVCKLRPPPSPLWVPQCDCPKCDAFRGLQNLTTLFLDKNMISVIPKYAFRGLTSLLHLYLNFNKLTSVPIEALLQLPTCKEPCRAHLTTNHIATIDSNILQLQQNPGLHIIIKDNKLRCDKGLEWFICNLHILDQIPYDDRIAMKCYDDVKGRLIKDISCPPYHDHTNTPQDNMSPTGHAEISITTAAEMVSPAINTTDLFNTTVPIGNHTESPNTNDMTASRQTTEMDNVILLEGDPAISHKDDNSTYIYVLAMIGAWSSSSSTKKRGRGGERTNRDQPTGTEENQTTSPTGSNEIQPYAVTYSDTSELQASSMNSTTSDAQTTPSDDDDTIQPYAVSYVDVSGKGQNGKLPPYATTSLAHVQSPEQNDDTIEPYAVSYVDVSGKGKNGKLPPYATTSLAHVQTPEQHDSIQPYAVTHDEDPGPQLQPYSVTYDEDPGPQLQPYSVTYDDDPGPQLQPYSVTHDEDPGPQLRPYAVTHDEDPGPQLRPYAVTYDENPGSQLQPDEDATIVKQPITCSDEQPPPTDANKESNPAHGQSEFQTSELYEVEEENMAPNTSRIYSNESEEQNTPDAMYKPANGQPDSQTSEPSVLYEVDTEPTRDLTAARPNCKSRSAPYHTPHGSRRATDRAPDGSLTETGRKSL
ncbi:hypothetical protein Bbelb_218800 [Branchiostoma belcheri]|nr:hypothetical protein Bbelb_218800 [Branchiostoma belcheri]